MADLYAKIIGTASNYLYSYVLIILLVGGGIYFTIRTKGVQLRYLLESIRVILEPSDKEDESISAFQALMVSLLRASAPEISPAFLPPSVSAVRALSSGCG